MSESGIRDMLVTGGGLPKMQNGAMTYFFGQRLTGYGGLLNHVGGEVWQRKRRALNPAFNPQYLRSLLPNMETVAGQLIEEIHQEHGLPIQVYTLAKRAAVRVIACTGFGITTEEAGFPVDQVVGMVEDLFNGMYHAALNPAFGWQPSGRGIKNKARNAGRVLRELGHFALKKRREGCCDGMDLLAHSIRIQEENSWYTDEEIVDDFVTFFIAGMETTANVLAFTLAQLSRHEGVQGRVREEIEEGRTTSYLESVIKETMRLHPPGSILRRCTTRNMKLGGWDVPADSMVLTLPWVLGRTKWGPDSLQFNPDRFMTSSSPPPLYYLPFLTGPRRCIGATFAMLELKTIVSAVVRHYSICQPVGEGLAEPIRGALKMTLYPVSGTVLTFKERL
eukprot:sb/3465505/